MPEPGRVLVVEDEAPIRCGLCDRLQREGFVALPAASLAEGRRALELRPDLLILDRRLPDGEGLDLLRELRASGARTPVIVLSALGQAQDRIAGLEDGADDYVTKPFHAAELLLRVRAVLARARAALEQEPRVLRFGAFELDVAPRVLRRGRREIPLTRLEFDLLLYLARHPHRAIGRNELLEHVWGHEHFPTTRTVDFHVLSLRRKIEPERGAPLHIVTLHRVGYRFEP